jgi:hypothetical protein
MPHSDLLQGFFQFGYVTTDLDAAMALYRDRFNVPEFLLLDVSGAPSGFRVGLAWIGAAMVELIQPGDEPRPLYAEALPKAGIRLHHLGYRVHEAARWSGILAGLAAHDLPILRMQTPDPDCLECLYADARPQLGHYLEFVWTKAGKPDFFADVPRAPG